MMTPPTPKSFQAPTSRVAQPLPESTACMKQSMHKNWTWKEDNIAKWFASVGSVISAYVTMSASLMESTCKHTYHEFRRENNLSQQWVGGTPIHRDLDVLWRMYKLCGWYVYMLQFKSFIDQAISHFIHSSMLTVSPSAAAICRWRRTPVNKANVYWHVQCSHVKKSKFKSCWGRWAALSLCPARKTTSMNCVLVVQYD